MSQSSRFLCTFSGKSGDILWALPTIKAISLGSSPVDLCIMPYYESLLPLLNYQSYIASAFVCTDWLRVHSNFGDQPWSPPDKVSVGYEKVWHLGYREHPNIPLARFTALQQNIVLPAEIVPFLEYKEREPEMEPYVAMGFSYVECPELKAAFVVELVRLFPEVRFIDMTQLSWMEAAGIAKNAVGFVGCMSANHVLAEAVGQKNIFIYEPHPSKHPEKGSLGEIFRNGTMEKTADLGLIPQASAHVAKAYIGMWMDKFEEHGR